MGQAGVPPPDAFLHRARRALSVLFVSAAALLGAGCAVLTPHAGSGPSPRESSSTITLDGQRLELHLAVPPAPARRELLVVYASGDGGWFGAAVDQWRQIARAGYATVGFSARALLRIDRPAGSPLNAARLANDYLQIVREAQRGLDVPDPGHVILAGWSRGAAFAVLVGTDPSFRSRLAGVLAIGLDESEDLKPFDTYAAVLRLPVRGAVIQATHDNYFPAAGARRRLGPDTATHRLYEVEARNHRFSGGAGAFNSALLDALSWISSPAVSHDEAGLAASDEVPRH